MLDFLLNGSSQTLQTLPETPEIHNPLIKSKCFRRKKESDECFPVYFYR